MNEDFGFYLCDEVCDVVLVEVVGVDIFFVFDVVEIYFDGFVIIIYVVEFMDVFDGVSCGLYYFDGVVIVVMKFFGIV